MEIQKDLRLDIKSVALQERMKCQVYKNCPNHNPTGEVDGAPNLCFDRLRDSTCGAYNGAVLRLSLWETGLLQPPARA